MCVSEIMKRMIDFSEGNPHDIAHFLKVYALAKTIGESEGLDEETQLVLEAAAITHDIACALCREKYGNSDGPRQEWDYRRQVRLLLKDTGLTDCQIDRASYVVGHLHAPGSVQGMDYQILVEADYLANADENSYPISKIRSDKNTLFQTASGISLLESIYFPQEKPES